MHQCGSVSKVSPCAKMAQDICSVPSSFPVISQLSTNVSSILSYSGYAYFAHPENLLLSMTMDDRQHIRELAIRRILRGAFIKSNISCATVQSTKSQVRRIAYEVCYLIDWQNSHITEPQLTTDISEDQLKLFVTSGEPPMADFPKLQCTLSYARLWNAASS